MKPCWCCDWLAQELRSGWRGDKVDFDLRNSHGIITPWILPAGIPLKKAIEMRRVLQWKLKKALPYEIRPSEDDSDDDESSIQ